jgi:hypothetical protein
MAIKHTFTVAIQGGTGHVAEWMAPESIDDKAWESRIAGDHKERTTISCSKAVAAGLIDLAKQSLVIKMQGAARPETVKGKAAVQAKVNSYCYGAKAAPTRPTVDAKEMGLTKVQAEALKAVGVEVLNMPAK